MRGSGSILTILAVAWLFSSQNAISREEEETLDGSGPEYVLNVDFLDMVWFGAPEGGLYLGRQIAALVEAASSHGFTRDLWRVSAFGKSMYPTKVREVYAGDNRPESRKAAEVLNRIDPLNVGAEECRKQGLKLYAWVTIYDDGGSYPGIDGVASGFSEEHPEYLWCSRDGTERFGGVLCYAYPEVRAHRLAEIEELLVYDVDGIFLSTRSHSRPNDTEEKFGFNEPIVEAYRDRYGVDIRTEEFDRQKWRDLRGEFLSQFVREAHELCASRGRELVMGLRAGEEIGWPLGRMTVDWRRWVREGWVDGICTYALNDVLFTPPEDVKSWLGKMSSVMKGKAELWVWVRLWDWSSRFEGSHVPGEEIGRRMQALLEIPGIDAFAFHEALLLEKFDLWEALKRKR